LNHTDRGIGAIFYSASRAVGCALHIQCVIAKRNAASPDDAVTLRIGLDGRKASARDGSDPFGVSTQRARQIAGWAEADQILASDVVSQLVRGKGFNFEPSGVRILKGFEEPVAVYTITPRGLSPLLQKRRDLTMQK
jgi:class 3 adenylate cyclase